MNNETGSGHAPDARPADGVRPTSDAEENATFDPGFTPKGAAGAPSSTGDGGGNGGGGDVIEPGDPAREKDLQSNAMPGDRAYEREVYEPSELSNPLPKWYAAMSLGLVIWGASYFYMQGVQPADAGDHRSVLALAADGPVDGAAVYAGNCVACHQGTGLGIAGAFPPLAGSGWVLGEPEVIGQILLHGIQGPIEVLGNTYNGLMPAFPQLSDAELAAVTNHVRNEWGNAASEVTPDWYAEQREVFPADRGAWTGGQEIIDEVGPPLAVAAGS